MKRECTDLVSACNFFKCYTQDEMARFMEGQGANSTVMRFRKAAVKARHQKELEGMRHRMEGEINQSLRELKAATDVKRMQALEAQVSSLSSQCIVHIPP